MTDARAARGAKGAKGRAPKRRGRGRGVGVAVALALVGVGGLGAYWFVTPRGGRGRVVRVDVPEGVDAGELTTRLWRAGAIDRPWAFRPLVALTGAHARVGAGMLPLRDDLAPYAVLRALLRGGGLVRVTVPEGFTRFDVARRLATAGVCAEEDFLARTEAPEVVTPVAGAAATTLEGWLFPDTYDLPARTTADEVIARMTRVATRRIEALQARHPDGVARAVAYARGDRAAVERVIVTLASLVERETGAPEDRAHVASVFWNRLTRPDFTPRLLQSDPTVVYGCLAGPRAGLFPPGPPCGDPDAGARMPITAAMLDDVRNPWNTYRHEALPPTPVCNPGAASLEAVLAPMASDDLYFVARGDGRSVFAATLEQHRRNVREHLRRPARAP